MNASACYAKGVKPFARVFFVLCLAVAMPLLPLSADAGNPCRLLVNRDNPGRIYEGIGALSAGASTRLLPDYPEPYRSQVLDYLFKPQYGASLDHLKVEIGGDVNSTCGTEPSHRRNRDEQPDFTRGYEWWLMREAKRRNPSITLDILQWGAPGWIGNGRFYSQDNADFVAEFIRGADSVHGLKIDYAGIWNETPYDTEYIKTLASTFRRKGIATKIVAADEVCAWSVADRMREDAELMDAVDVIGTHYPPQGSTKNALMTGKPLWASEEGATMPDRWEAAKHLIRRFNRGYTEGKIVRQVVWSVVGAYYDLLPVPESGLLNARTPWSGAYELKPALWTVAHYTQFARPGWIYCESASRYDASEQISYVTLYDPQGDDFSVVLETVDAETPRQLELEIGRGLADKVLYVWRTNRTASFEQIATLHPADGRVSFEAQPGSIYTLTTTTGQRKGDETLQRAAARPFPFPYRDDFEDSEPQHQPRYLSDQSGVFEVVELSGRGNVLKQAIPQRGIEWLYHVNPDPHTLVGDRAWRDYAIRVDVLLPDHTASALVMGRVGAMYQHTRTLPNGYWLRFHADGRWELGKTEASLLNGHLDFKNDWPELYARFTDRDQCLHLSYDELQALPEGRKEKLRKLFDRMAEESDPENLFLEALIFGMYDLRRDGTLARGQVSVQPGGWISLELRFSGDRIEALADGKRLVELHDNSFAAGMAGIGCSYDPVCFDNLMISPL